MTRSYCCHCILILLLLAGGCSTGALTHGDSQQQARELIDSARASLEAGNYTAVREHLRRYTEVSPHNAETLWLGVQAEYALGDQRAVSTYVQQLREQFPESAEYRAYLDFLRSRGFGH